MCFWLVGKRTMRLKRPEGMNIIPFIDIMLVLLTIVLTISTFIAQTHIPLELPSGSSGQRLKEKQRHEIIISQEGTLYWDESLVSLEILKETLTTLLREDEIVIKADTNSSFGRFIEVVDYLKSIEYPHINIVVRKE